MIGTIPHSQDGKKKPAKIPTITRKNLFLGRNLATIFGDKQVSMIPATKQPNNTNGNASIIMDKKIAANCDQTSGRLFNIF